MQYVKFEHCNLPKEIDDDENNENEESEKDNGNKISIDVYGIHKDMKKHCEDSLVGEHVKNIEESIQLNKINET